MQLPDYKRIALIFVLIVALTCAFLPAVATAQTTAIFTGTGEGENIWSRYYGNNVQAKVFNMNVNGTIYEGFCIDLYTTISVGNTLLVNGPLSEDIRDQVDWCAVNYIIHTYGERNGPDALASNTEAASVQAAIWYLVTEPLGAYTGSGQYQFMSDPLSPGNYDAYRTTTPRDTVRNRAFAMIAAARPPGGCTFRFPVNITLTPKTSDIAPNGTPGDFVDICAFVADQHGAGLGNITVQFVNAGPGGGVVNASSPVTDQDGNACVRFYAGPGADHTHIDAYVTGNYGTLLFDPGRNRQSVTTLTLLPYSITDRAQVFWTEDPSVMIAKYISTDNATWVLANISPGIHVLEGYPVYYRFIVTNDGNVTLNGITLQDPGVGIDETISTLNPGDSATYFSGEVTAGMGVRCNLANVSVTYNSTVYADESQACYNGTPTYTKSGCVFIDGNGNGIRDDGEGVPDVLLLICTLCDETFPVSTVNITRTNATGCYEVNLLEAGDYNVSVPRYPGQEAANTPLFAGNYPVLDVDVKYIYTPFEGIYRKFTLGPDDSRNNDFAFLPYGNISGLKFKDYNSNGIRNVNDEPLSGWVITLRYENGTVFNTTTTGADGSYLFDTVPWGNFTISETLKSGWKQTAPAGKTYTVEINATSLSVTGKDFGNMRIQDCCACPIKAYFTYKQVSSPARTIQFTDKSTGYVTDWSWNFGDGTTSVERNPTKTYGKKGTYTVKQYAQTIKCDGKTAWVSYTAKVTVK